MVAPWRTLPSTSSVISGLRVRTRMPRPEPSRPWRNAKRASAISAVVTSATSSKFIGGVGRWVDPVTADRLVGAMVAHQDSDPMIGVAVVVTLTPGLKALARRMDWGSGGPWGGAEVFSGELMSTAWEVVADWSGRRQEFMVPAILTAIRKRLIRRTQAWRRETDRRTEWSMIAEPEGSSESVIEELARVLENAADQMISRGRRVVGLRASGARAFHGRVGQDDGAEQELPPPPGDLCRTAVVCLIKIETVRKFHRPSAHTGPGPWSLWSSPRAVAGSSGLGHVGCRRGVRRFHPAP